MAFLVLDAEREREVKPKVVLVKCKVAQLEEVGQEVIEVDEVVMEAEVIQWGIKVDEADMVAEDQAEAEAEEVVHTQMLLRLEVAAVAVAEAAH